MRTAIQGVHALQDRLLQLLGATLEGRAQVVEGMLVRGPNESATYWLQLGVSIGIATLGLVVGSAAVIIGAMLVAPLMGPILVLAMGLSTGSPFLVLRSASRIFLSVVVAVLGSALIAVMLPFHELNAEITARTSPTVLDLLTAGFCALAGVYATLRPGSDTATTAAGTSIGISLVPPLCAAGYGVGAKMGEVAAGAALLFLTNLVAIIFVGMLAFVAAGFNRVKVANLERGALAHQQNATLTAAIARRLAGVFESRAGPFLRFSMPVLLLAAVYVPLRRALDEVAWEVRARTAVHEALARERYQMVQTRIRVERHTIQVQAVLLGSTGDARAVRGRVEASVHANSGVAPRVEVLALPDASAFAGLEATLRTSREPLPITPASNVVPASERLRDATELVRSKLAPIWPVDSAGELLAVDIGLAQAGGGPLRVRLVHYGPALSTDAVEAIARSLGAELGLELRLFAGAIPAQVLAPCGHEADFLARVSRGLAAAEGASDVQVCVTEPALPDKPSRSDERKRALQRALRAVLGSHPNVVSRPGPDLRVHFARGTCPEPNGLQEAALCADAEDIGRAQRGRGP